MVNDHQCTGKTLNGRECECHCNPDFSAISDKDLVCTRQHMDWIQNPIVSVSGPASSSLDLVQKFISEGKLPKLRQEVLAWTAEGGLVTAAQLIEDGEPMEKTNFIRWSPPYLTVLYWMPRPEKPKQLQ